MPRRLKVLFSSAYSRSVTRAVPEIFPTNDTLLVTKPLQYRILTDILRQDRLRRLGPIYAFECPSERENVLHTKGLPVR